MKIKARRITAAGFRGFGKPVLNPHGTPTSQGAQYKFWSDLANYLIDGRTEIGVCTVTRQKRSMVCGLERHLRSPEILIPIDGPFILPLRRGRKSAAFLVNVGEAVVINPGIWHGACLPSRARKSSYFVIFRRGTPRHDVFSKPIAPVEIFK